MDEADRDGVQEVQLLPALAADDDHRTEGNPGMTKATEAARAALAKALGVAKTRLTLMRGATSRDKLFRLDG